MAQTIAMQKGSTAITLNGTSRYTIFTQSSGIATRVIINGFSINYGTSSSGNSSMALFILNSGTTIYTPVAYKNASSAVAANGLSFFSGMGNSNASAQRASTANTPTSAVVLVQTVGGWMNAADVYFTGGDSATSPGQSTGNWEYCPQNFWLGNGDSLILSAYTPNTVTGTAAWNLTTITES